MGNITMVFLCIVRLTIRRPPRRKHGYRSRYPITQIAHQRAGRKVTNRVSQTKHGLHNPDPASSDPSLSPQIQDALRRGNKIEAIKIYRELTGVGLAEAKQAIDRAGQFIK